MDVEKHERPHGDGQYRRQHCGHRAEIVEEAFPSGHDHADHDPHHHTQRHLAAKHLAGHDATVAGVTPFGLKASAFEKDRDGGDCYRSPVSTHETEVPDRNLGMELVRATEAGSLAAARWMGRGEKEKADGAAVEAMRVLLNRVAMTGVVVIGEGEKDEAPMLYNGEELGTGVPPRVDIAVDPVEGTTLTALGQPNALSVIAASDQGTMFDPGPAFYMRKVAVGPVAAGSIDIDRPPAENLEAVAKALGKSVRDVTAVVLNRPRHDDLIAAIRAAGARIRLINDGDVAGGISTGWPDAGADILFSIGGTPEGVITASALKCMGGEIQARLEPRDDEERQKIIDFGIDPDRILGTNDLVSGDNCFFACTGITDGELVSGVHYDNRGATTSSMVMRSKSGTVRTVTARYPADHPNVV